MLAGFFSRFSETVKSELCLTVMQKNSHLYRNALYILFYYFIQ